MKSLFGISWIQVKAIEVDKNDLTEVNNFLQEYNGNIIDINVIPMMYGKSRFVVTYKAASEY